MSEPAGSGPVTPVKPDLSGVEVRQPTAPGPGVPEGLSATSGPSVQKQAAGLTPDEERTLGELEAKRRAATPAAAIQLRVEPPHSAMVHAGVTIGTDWTDVPRHMVPALTTAADNAGVTLSQQTRDENEESN